MSTKPRTKKRKKGGIWIPPRDVRIAYKLRKRFPIFVDIDNHMVIAGLFRINPDMRIWMHNIIGKDNFVFIFQESDVRFCFKDESLRDKFLMHFFPEIYQKTFEEEELNKPKVTVDA